MADGTSVRIANKPVFVQLTVEIVSAYVSNNSIRHTDLPALLSNVHAAIAEVGSRSTQAKDSPEKPTPAQIRKSITHDHIVSFEDGKPYKTLRRHLTLRGLSPEAYREKWGLPRDYPMTAASYSAQRSELARALGLGQQRRKHRGASSATAEAPAAATRKARARRKAPAE